LEVCREKKAFVKFPEDVREAIEAARTDKEEQRIDAPFAPAMHSPLRRPFRSQNG